MVPGVVNVVFIALVLSAVDAAVTGVPPRSSSGPGMMRLKDGRPVPIPFPTRRAAHPSPQARLDMQEMMRRYVDDMLTKELKHQTDHTKMEKVLRDMLLWRKTMFHTPSV